MVVVQCNRESHSIGISCKKEVVEFCSIPGAEAALAVSRLAEMALASMSSSSSLSSASSRMKAVASNSSRLPSPPPSLLPGPAKAWAVESAFTPGLG